MRCAEEKGERTLVLASSSATATAMIEGSPLLLLAVDERIWGGENEGLFVAAAVGVGVREPQRYP